MDIKIPFSGFYYTRWSDEVDECISRRVDGEMEDRSLDADLKQKVADIFFNNTDYKAAYTNVAKAYAEEVQRYLDDVLELDVVLVWDEMTSPKFYNYETDRIFCKISLEDAQKLLECADKLQLASLAKAEYTSRPGFMSFYSVSVEKWGELAEWDHNQLGTLLQVVLGGVDNDEWTWSIYHHITEQSYELVEGTINWKRVEYELDLLEQCEEEGEDVKDGRNYPIGVTDATEYVSKFIEENNYVST